MFIPSIPADIVPKFLPEHLLTLPDPGQVAAVAGGVVLSQGQGPGPPFADAGMVPPGLGQMVGQGPDGDLGLDIDVPDRPASLLDDVVMDAPGQVVMPDLAEAEVDPALGALCPSDAEGLVEIDAVMLTTRPRPRDPVRPGQS